MRAILILPTPRPSSSTASTTSTLLRNDLRCYPFLPYQFASRPPPHALADDPAPDEPLLGGACAAMSKPSGSFPAQNLLNRDGTGSILLADNLPNSPKPQPQRLVGVLKHGASGSGRLIPTNPANQPSPSCRPGFFGLASRTHESIRPTQFRQILPTGLFAAKSLFEFQDGARVIFHAPAYYILGSVESIG